MNANVARNENWGTCPQCGEPVLIDPNSGQAEPCATCASLSSQGVGRLGIFLLVSGTAAVAALIYVCVRILL